MDEPVVELEQAWSFAAPPAKEVQAVVAELVVPITDLSLFSGTMQHYTVKLPQALMPGQLAEAVP